MSETETSFVQTIGEYKIRSAIVLFAIVVAVAILIWAIWPSLSPSWTGFFPNEGAAINRSLWDWLELMLIPAALLLGAWWVSHPKQDKKSDLSGVEIAGLSQLEAIESQHQEKRIQLYFDTMTELMLKHGLHNSPADDDVRRVARAQTMTVLWGLNSERKGALARFLYESQLIQHPDPVVSLAGANLSSADLSGVNLSEADLRQAHLNEANLADAHLHRADLGGADLTGADLHGAVPTELPIGVTRWVPPNLSRANLNEAILRDACLGETDLTDASLRGAFLDRADLHEAILRGADLQGAQLKDANLKRANLKEANLSEADLNGAQIKEATMAKAILKGATMSSVDAWQANLKEADLSDANLSKAQLSMAFLYKSNLRGANLSGANLRGANLSHADLTDATLVGADLRGAYLSAAEVTSEQLSSALSLEGAVMPNNERMGIPLGVDGQSNGTPQFFYQTSDNNSDS